MVEAEVEEEAEVVEGSATAFEGVWRRQRVLRNEMGERWERKRKRVREEEDERRRTRRMEEKDGGRGSGSADQLFVA